MNEKDQVLIALANPKFTWRTVEGVSRDTKIEATRVLELIEAMPEVVIRSRVPDAQGRPLFTTRDHYKAHSSIDRFIDHFRTTST